MNFFQFLALLGARWSADSPVLFQKFAAFGVSLIATGTAMAGVSMVNGVTLPAIIPKIGAGMIIAGTCIGFVSKLTVQDPTQLPVITTTSTTTSTTVNPTPTSTTTNTGNAAANVVTKQ